MSCGAGTPSVTYGGSINCVATVTSLGGTPTGNVAWTTNGAGAFDSGTCILSSGSCSVNYTPSAVGTGSHLITATYGGSSPFLASNGNQNVTVNPKAASVTANGRTKTYGDTVTFAGTEFTTLGLIGSDSVMSVTLTSGGAAAGATVALSPYTIVPSAAVGSGLTNYTMTYNNGSLTVNAKALDVTANNRTKTYGDAITFAGTEFTTSGLVNADAVTHVTLNSSGAAVGATVALSPYTIVPSAAVGTGLTNYAIAYHNGALTVNVKVLTTSGIVVTSRAYDGTTNAPLNTGSASLVGVVGSDAVSLNSGAASATFADANVGTHKPVTAGGFGLSGAAAGNYSLTQPVGLTGDITAKGLTITGLAVNNKVYNSNTIATLNTAGASLVGVVDFGRREPGQQRC